jgi:hypothetical protein
MKKLVSICVSLVLCACAQSTGAGNGLTRLNSEPKNCEFLYTIDSSVSTYKIADAYDFIEKRIMEEKGFGDSYFIDQEDIMKNPGAIFGPKNTYKLKAKVYKCNS